MVKNTQALISLLNQRVNCLHSFRDELKFILEICGGAFCFWVGG